MLTSQQLKNELRLHCAKMGNNCDECIFSQHLKIHQFGTGCLAQSPWRNNHISPIELCCFINAELIYEQFNL
jgi:hypothetical protein